MGLILFINTYKDSFLNSTTGLSSSWDEGTLYFYFSIIIFTLFLGWIIEKSKERRRKQVSLKPYFIFLGFILICFLGLRGQGVGTDTLNYILCVSESQSYMWTGEEMEPGFMLANRFLNIFFSNGHVTLFFFSTITVSLVFVSLWKYKRSINLFFALGFFVGAYYFQALNLLRIYLAASVVLWAFHFLIDGKISKYILWVIIAATIHMSSLVMLLPLAYYFVYIKNGRLAFAVLCVALLSVVSVASHFSDYLTLQRYAAYGETNEFEGGFGIMLLVDYLPGLILIWYIRKHKINGIWSDMLICFTMVAIFVRSIGYYIIIAGRMGTHFMIIYLLLVPYFLNEMKKNRRKEYFPFVCFLFVFLLFKIHMYFVGYLASDGIMPYYFLWNE